MVAVAIIDGPGDDFKLRSQPDMVGQAAALLSHLYILNVYWTQ
jgi:hypothetical protein